MTNSRNGTYILQPATSLLNTKYHHKRIPDCKPEIQLPTVGMFVRWHDSHYMSTWWRIRTFFCGWLKILQIEGCQNLLVMTGATLQWQKTKTTLQWPKRKSQPAFAVQLCAILDEVNLPAMSIAISQQLHCSCCENCYNVLTTASIGQSVKQNFHDLLRLNLPPNWKRFRELKCACADDSTCYENGDILLMRKCCGIRLY